MDRLFGIYDLKRIIPFKQHDIHTFENYLDIKP